MYTDLNPNPITACCYCNRSFSNEGARWQHLFDIHGVGADERLYLTQGSVEARAQFIDIILDAQAKDRADSRYGVSDGKA